MLVALVLALARAEREERRAVWGERSGVHGEELDGIVGGVRWMRGGGDCELSSLTVATGLLAAREVHRLLDGVADYVARAEQGEEIASAPELRGPEPAQASQVEDWALAG